MNPRAWVIGAQGAAVALLVLIVYMTLLRGDSGTPLPDIQAPGAEQQAHGPEGGGGDASPVFRGPSPPADQYLDAVSGLLSKVRGAPGAP